MQNKIYLRILLSFLIVASFYTLIIAATMIKNTYSQQRSDAINQIKTNLQQEANIMDEQLLAANNTALALASKTSTQHLAATQPNNYRPYANVYADITANPDFTNYSSQYTVGVARYFNSKIISSSGYFNFRPYLKFMQIDGAHKQIAHFFAHTPDAGVQIIEEGNHVLLLRMMRVSGSDHPVYFLMTWINNSLSPLTIYNNKGDLLLIDTVSADAQSKLPDVQKVNATLTQRQDNNSMVLQHHSGSKQYFVRQSNVIPTLLFTYRISNQALYQMPANLIKMLVVYFLVLLFVGGLLVIYLSRRSFRPYAKIIDEVQQIDSNVQPQNAEILLEKIHGLVESNHRYTQMQNDVTHDLKLLFLKNLLLNSYSAKDIKRFSNILALPELEHGGTIGIITFAKIAMSEEPLGINERKDARKKNIQTSWPTPLSLVFDIDMNHYAVISGGLTETESFAITIKTVAHILTRRLNVPVHALVSVPFHTLYEIPTRFADVYSTATATPEDQPTVSSNIMTSTGNYTIETETEIITNVGRRDFDKALQLLDDAVSKALASDKATLAELTNIKFVFLNTLKRILEASGVSVADFIDENQPLIAQLDFETATSSIQKSLLALFQSALDEIGELSQHHRSLEEHIVDYIKRRYKSDLALSEIADHYHLSESHTSRLIKDHLGISFKNYLIQLRIREAKSLLRNTDQKIATIAEQVGYQNVNTFIRVFKNTTGQTPGKFRRNDTPEV